MKIFSFGSLNIDHTYQLEHFVQKGETISAHQLQNFSGGKGLNQSIALARAGALVVHAGAIGEDGQFLLDEMQKSGVDISQVQILKDIPTGHAIIQIDASGDNCILLYGGANRRITTEYVDEVLSNVSEGDMLVLQNEINHLPYIVEEAKKKGMKIVLNPSPMDEKIFEIPLDKIDVFLLNEVEASQLVGENNLSAEVLIKALQEKYQDAEIVLTLGEKGAVYSGKGMIYMQEAVKVKAVDTTAAGDTFTGYYLAGIVEGISVQESMKQASIAAAIAVGRKGASPSIPYKEEVSEFKL